jgi:peptide/nickel transport system substrate-binding protein
MATLVTACGGGSSSGGTAQQGGVVNWAELPGSAPTWIFPFIDSADNSIANVAQFEYLMYRPLYWTGNGSSPDVDFNLSLADKPTYSGNTAVVNLKNYQWSNGEKLTPTDVMFFMNMLFAEKANYSQYVPGEFPDNVTSVKQTGPEQVTFTLNSNYSPDWFTGNQLFQITPMPEAWDKTSDSAAAGSGGCATDQSKCAAVYNYLIAANKDVSSYATSPLWQVVDGPWKLKSFTSEGAADLVPNPKYSGPNKPKLDQFNEVPFTSPEAMYNAEKANKTIQVGEIPASDLPQRDPTSADLTPPSNPLGNGNYSLVNDPVWGWSYGFLNYNNPTMGPAFKQLYVRQALQDTIDQLTDAKVAARGYAVPATGPVPNQPATQYLSSEQKLNNGEGPYQFNVNKAKALLTSHGWTEQSGVMTCTSAGTAANQCGDGVAAGSKLSLNLEYANGSTTAQEEIQQWKSDASQAGIQLNLASQPFNTVISDIATCPAKPNTCNWQVSYFGYETFDAVPTGDGFFLPNSSINLGGVNDPKLTNLVNATLHDNSNKTFQAYENYVADQLPASFNFADAYKVYAAAKNLTGVSINAVQGINPENWAFTK